MKRKIYITGFVILGILAQFLVHATLEIWQINRLVRDFERYHHGLSWSQWVMIHHVGAVILFLAGAWIGYLQGRFWWREIYEKGLLGKFKNWWYNWRK